MNGARDLAFEVLDAFRDELAGRFIDLCYGNDYNKLTLEKIYDTIGEVYDKHIEKWADVGTVDVVPLLKWISVKERLPEKGEVVLTRDRYGHLRDRTLKQLGNTMLFTPDGLEPKRHITHWMPLPEPPTPKEEPT